MYYRNAQAAVVVYDVTKSTSLEKAKSWVKELQRQANPNIVIALAGNKVDLVQPSASSSGSSSSPDSEDEADDATATPGENPGTPGEPESLRQVPREEAHAYAQEAGLLFFETSAKTGEGIVEIFTEIGQHESLVRCISFLIPSSPTQPKRFQSSTSWPPLVTTPIVQDPAVVIAMRERTTSTYRTINQRRRMLVTAEDLTLLSLITYSDHFFHLLF